MRKLSGVSISRFSEKGEFTLDYVHETLPHIFSCVRRLPSYLAAPNALISPYLIVEPDKSRSAYLQGGLCRQGYYKVEDFVWRFTLPKTCFLPTGQYLILSQGHLADQNSLLASAKISAIIKLFDLTLLRNQKDFLQYTDTTPTGTTSDIKIGPEFEDCTSYPSRFLGFVGLKDFDRDMLFDPFMTQGDNQEGYRPQIVMNFDPEDAKYGLENLAGPLPAQQGQNDNWLSVLSVQQKEKISDSFLEDSRTSVFGVFGASGDVDACDLSPFGGLYLWGNAHGEFAERGFTDSLYWRLDSWLTDPSKAVGAQSSAGLMTFWFRMSSDYPFWHDISPDFSNNNIIDSKAITRVLMSLNLWESYEWDLNSETPVVRPVTLTVGLKKTKGQGNSTTPYYDRLFIRYDTGGASHTASLPPNLYLGDPLFPLRDSLFNDQLEAHDYLGMLLNSVQDAKIWSEDPLDYKAYRSVAHRSAEAHIYFAQEAATAGRSRAIPASWHRVTAGWNFRSSFPWFSLESREQIWIFLHDSANQHLGKSNPKFHQGIEYGTVANPDFLYPGNNNSNFQNGGGLGLILPMNPLMTLSFGEAHAMRVQGYQMDAKSSAPDMYYPFWRLNSCIDNIRFYMGSSDNSNYPVSGIFPDYLKFRSDAYLGDGVSPGTNSASAMRYFVMNPSYGAAHPRKNEPRWSLEFNVKKGSRLLATAARIYYPQSNNTPYVRMKVLKNGNELPPLPKMPDNEQLFLFLKKKMDDTMRLQFQYLAYQPELDGDLETPVLKTGLRYSGYMKPDPPRSVSGGHFTEIPWIKEVSWRSIPPEGLQIIHYREN
jgi:hypothetical protein